MKNSLLSITYTSENISNKIFLKCINKIKLYSGGYRTSKKAHGNYIDENRLYNFSSINQNKL